MKDEQIKKTADDNTAESAKKMRRKFLKYAGLGAGGMALIGCANEILENSPSSKVSRSTNASTDLTLHDGGVYRGDSVKTVEDLKSYVSGGEDTSERALLVRGYHFVGDGGGGFFYWDDNPGEADNGGTVIQPNGYAGTGRWMRLYDGPVNVKWFGAKGDGNSPGDGDAFESTISAANNAIVFVPNGTYILDEVELPTNGNVVKSGNGIGNTILKHKAGSTSSMLGFCSTFFATLR